MISKARSLKFYSIVFLTFHTFPAFCKASYFSALQKLSTQNEARYSALIVNLSTNKVIAEKNADLSLTPASVTKLIVGAKSLETWGNNKSFISKIFMRGTLTDGTLNGDLIFYGVGDPSLTNEKLWFLTTDVERYGIKKVTGKIVVNNSFFGSVTDDKSRSFAKKKSHNAYDSQLSSSAVNFSVLAIVVNPSFKTGAHAEIALEPYKLGNVKILGSVKTSASGTQPLISVTRTTKQKMDIFTVSGQIPLGGKTQRIYRSVSDPDIYAAETINAFLKKAGIETTDNTAIESNFIKSSDILVSQVDGFPLSTQLNGLFRQSNNFIADMLTLKLLNEKGSEPEVSLEEGGNLLQKYIEQIISNSRYTASYKNSSPLKLDSGSGLTPSNHLSARNIVTILDHMYINAKEFPAFIAALPSPGEEGTLKKRFNNFSDNNILANLRAKTGTLTEPYPIASLAGYSRLTNGDWVAFAFIANGRSQKSTDITSLRNAIDDDLFEVLSSESSM